jgi:hypothetical protein
MEPYISTSFSLLLNNIHCMDLPHLTFPFISLPYSNMVYELINFQMLSQHSSMLDAYMLMLLYLAD